MRRRRDASAALVLTFPAHLGEWASRQEIVSFFALLHKALERQMYRVRGVGADIFSSSLLLDRYPGHPRPAEGLCSEDLCPLGSRINMCSNAKLVDFTALVDGISCEYC